MTHVKTNKTLTAWRAAGAILLRRAAPYLLSYGASLAPIIVGARYPMPNYTVDVGILLIGLTTFVIATKMLFGFSTFAGNTLFDAIDTLTDEQIAAAKRPPPLPTRTRRDPQ